MSCICTCRRFIDRLPPKGLGNKMRVYNIGRKNWPEMGTSLTSKTGNRNKRVLFRLGGCD